MSSYDYDKHRPIRHKFYKSKAWKEVRNYYFNLKHGMCERCRINKGIYVKGDIVHHKIHIKDEDYITNNIKILLDINNLEVLCINCHNKEHFKSSAIESNGEFDEQGNYKIKN